MALRTLDTAIVRDSETRDLLDVICRTELPEACFNVYYNLLHVFCAYDS